MPNAKRQIEKTTPSCLRNCALGIWHLALGIRVSPSITALLVMLVCTVALAGEIVLQVPEDMKVRSAVADAPPDIKSSSDGAIKGRTITFAKLLSDTPYNIQLNLLDGTVLQGVNMDWYNEEPAKADADPLSDDDRKEITAIINVPSFYNRSDILLLRGDHDRAVVLTQLIRDKAFHSDKGDEVIWRIELWYFKNQYGGWAKISNVQKVLRRERFKSHEEYDQATAKLKWIGQLGGITVKKNQTANITYPPPTTQP